MPGGANPPTAGKEIIPVNPIDLFSPAPVDFIELGPADVQRYNRKADAYYRSFANAAFECNKPFANYREAAMISYQIGLLLSGAKIGRAQRIMELGAGAGWLASMLHRLGNEVYLLEVSAAALEMARRTFAEDARNRLHAIGPHFDHYDGFDFPYPDRYFDRVVCFDALHHVPNPERILRETYRVLKPGGVAGFAESGEGHARLQAIRDCVARTGILERSTRLDDVRLIAREAGFSRVTVKAFPAYDAWEVDAATITAARRTGEPVVDIRQVAEGFLAGNQTVFMLYKGDFEFDGTYPCEPRAMIKLEQDAIAARAGSQLTVPVRIENTGRTRFNAAPHPLGGFTQIGAHLYRGDELVNFDLFHHPLPHDIDCGQSARFEVTFTVPEHAGIHRLEWDVVIEGVAWLSQMGSPQVSQDLDVKCQGA